MFLLSSEWLTPLHIYYLILILFYFVIIIFFVLIIFLHGMDEETA